MSNLVDEIINGIIENNIIKNAIKAQNQLNMLDNICNLTPIKLNKEQKANNINNSEVLYINPKEYYESFKLDKKWIELSTDIRNEYIEKWENSVNFNKI